MKRFAWKIFWCLLPVVLAGVVVGRAYQQYEREGGGFKLGVDLVGGTILVYEVDESKSLQTSDTKNTRDELAAALKRRIDPWTCTTSRFGRWARRANASRSSCRPAACISRNSK